MICTNGRIPLLRKSLFELYDCFSTIYSLSFQNIRNVVYCMCNGKSTSVSASVTCALTAQLKATSSLHHHFFFTTQHNDSVNFGSPIIGMGALSTSSCG